MLRKTIVFFLLTSTLCYGVNRPTGYMGKKLIVSSRIGVSMLSFNPIDYTTNQYFIPKNIFGGSADYVMGRSAVCSFIYEGYKAGVDYPNNINYYTKKNFPAVLYANKFGLGIKLFRRGYYAPVGKYIKVEFQLITSETRYEKFIMTGTNKYKSLGITSYKFNTFSFNYTIGKSRILFDYLVLDYGIRLGVTPNIFVLTGEILDYSSSGNLSMESSNFDYYGKQKIFFQQLLNVHLNIGFLAL